jgi:hypothetical protein
VNFDTYFGKTQAMENGHEILIMKCLGYCKELQERKVEVRFGGRKSAQTGKEQH